MSLLKHIFLLSAIFLALGIKAETASVLVGDIYYTLSGTDATVTAKEIGRATDTYVGSLAIPSTVRYNGKEYSVTGIAAYAFYKCNGLTGITIPNTVNSIGNHAFANCTKLTSVCIPETVTSIEESTFNNCTSLENVTIGKGVRSIGETAFNKCSALSSVIILATTPPELASDAFSFTEFTLTVPKGCRSAYATAAVWSGISTITEQGDVIETTSLAFERKRMLMLTSRTIRQMPVITPATADTQAVSWSSSNAAIATVDANGNVTGIAKGSATITATTTDGSGLSASYRVYVFEPGIPGDMNGDGEITVADANEIMNFYLKEY